MNRGIIAINLVGYGVGCVTSRMRDRFLDELGLCRMKIWKDEGMRLKTRKERTGFSLKKRNL